MLFKELKDLVIEAEEENVPADGNTDVTNVAPIQRKPKKVIQDVKDASDGIGNEAYSVSNELANTLETDLTEYYNIDSVKASNNKITIIANVKKMKNNQITSKMTGDPISSETLLDTIQQIIAADLGKDLDKYKLTGPKEVAPGIFIIVVIPI